MDRYALAVLIEPIQRELGLSDRQIGVLTGVAFAIAFSAAALPIARIADRVSRRTIIGLAVTFWSICTAAVAAGTNFAHLIAARIGVAIGEAGGYSPVQSLLGDMYPRERRAGALGIVLTFGMLGVTVGFALAGVVADAYGWRSAFLCMGIAGAVLGPIALLGLQEPTRGLSDGFAVDTRPTSTSEAFSELVSRPSFLLVIVGFCISGLAAYGTTVWVPTYFARRFALSTTEVGTIASLYLAVPTTIGTLAGGILCNRLVRRDGRWSVWFPGLCLIACGPIQSLQFLAPTASLAAMATIVPSFVGGAFAPPLLASLQTLSGARLRATGTSVGAFAALLVGQGAGPTLIGFLSQFFIGSWRMAPMRSLQIALLCALTLYVVGGFFVVMAARYYADDIVGSRAFDQGTPTQRRTVEAAD